jgi:hypothetical protein
MPTLLSPRSRSPIALIQVTPDPVAVQLGPIPVHRYGVCYGIGFAAAYLIMTREARRRGLTAQVVEKGIVVVGVAGFSAAGSTTSSTSGTGTPAIRWRSCCRRTRVWASSAGSSPGRSPCSSSCASGERTSGAGRTSSPRARS